MHRIDHEQLSYVILRLKRARHPDAVCLERLEHFLKACSRRNVSVLLAALQPDLHAAAQRLGFFTWFPSNQAYIQGRDEESATLSAIRAVYRELENAHPGPGSERPLYHLI
jgi:sulfate permease, SulP family